MIKAVLFDLDGTFVDTAFDLFETANIVFASNRKPNISYDGIKAFLRLRFDEKLDNFDVLSEEFLTVYKQQYLNNPVLFDGIENLLLDLEGKGIKWGIVTNKARYFAENIMKYHQLFDSCSVMMCGDDYGFKPKPSPELLIEACRLLDTNISDVIYIGDGHRDILSANSAKIKSVLACYGYLKKGDLIEEWQPNYIIHKPSEVVDLDIFSLNNSLS